MSFKTPAFSQADPRTLLPNPWNTNVVSPDNEAKLDASVKRFGMFKPVIVRELEDGSLQILGGEHRSASAIRLGMVKVPIVNLGSVDDAKAKEIGLVDNGRYGEDNTLELAELLESLGTSADELASFMPYSESDIASIFSSVNIALDDLDIPDADDSTPSAPREKPVQTQQIIRFKVPSEDAGKVTDLIERVMKTQGFTAGDSLSNAGDALVYICAAAKV